MIFLIFSFILTLCSCCTSFLATCGATEDSSSFITYNADGFTSYANLFFSAAQDWPKGTKILGKIPQVPHTFNVVGISNEKQVSFGETTWSNMRPELVNQEGGLIAYWDLMWITLQRSSTAREVIYWIGELLSKYGYASTGESFSIGDKNETWIMEVVGKGNFSLGAVWVAMRVPDGYISAHANQARIRQFPLDDPENCVYAKDTISFARDRGWFSGKDVDFSFSDIYSPVTFESARWCEARVYDIFNKVSSPGSMDKYLDYVQGKNLTNRMPLWIKPEKKLNGVLDVMKIMRSHYENTWFDMVGEFDVGNQPFYSGDRFLPLKWKASNGKTYVFERSISIQKTATASISQMRKWMPDGMSILWFSFDDTKTNVYVPFYTSLKMVPLGYSLHKDFSFESVFWMQNIVSNWAYYRYDVISKDVVEKQNELERGYLDLVKEKVDGTALKLFKEKGKEEAYEFLSKFSVETGNEFLVTWKTFFGSLFQKFFDSAGQQSGYNSKWYDFIVEKTGDHFLYRGDDPL